MERNDDTLESMQKFFSFVIVAAGGMVLIAGIVLGFETFYQAREILEDPSPLKKWIELSDEIRKISLSSEASARGEPGITRYGGGYATLFVSVIFLYVMARIALVLISKGGEIMMYGIKQLRSN